MCLWYSKYMEIKPTALMSATGLLLLLILLIGFSYKGCINAANEESLYNNRVQSAASRWVAVQLQMQLTPSSIMCVARTFGKRMPDELTSCRALTSANYRVALLCNMQGCTLDHSNYQF